MKLPLFSYFPPWIFFPLHPGASCLSKSHPVTVMKFDKVPGESAAAPGHVFFVFVLAGFPISFFYPTKICNPFRSCPLTMVQTLFSNCHTLFSSIVRVTVFSFNFLVDTSVDKWIPSARVRWSNFVEMAGCVYQILTLRAGMKPLQMG